MSRLVVVHDVLGTLFSLSAPIEELQAIFKEQLENENAPPILPELIIMDWYHAAQRDFTTLSINNAYQPIGPVFKGTLPRVLLQAGLVPPEQYKKGKQSLAKGGSYLELPGNEDPFDASVTERIMSSLGGLQPRPGMVNAFTKVYRNRDLVPDGIQRVDLWAATNGGLALGEKIFKGALGDDVKISTGKDTSTRGQNEGEGLGHGVNLFSCDEIQIAKPEAKVYKEIRGRIEGDDQAGPTLLWFVASHTWDLFAARKAGFKTAWVGYEEFYTCPSIYEKPDIIAKDLEDAARQILLFEGSSK